MNILIIGDEDNFSEVQQKFGSGHQYTHALNHREALKFISTITLVVDFIIDESPNEVFIYEDYANTLLCNTAKITLQEILLCVKKPMKGKIFGFNGLPTFLLLPVIEISVCKKEDEEDLKKLAAEIAFDYLVVDDRVGLVTPRIVCMIINEAYYTVQEGTASKTDIDLAMKLGTNYPFGPFAWCEQIGLHNVYELLEAVYEDTRDERYKICPLLKKEYLKLLNGH